MRFYEDGATLVVDFDSGNVDAAEGRIRVVLGDEGGLTEG